MQALYSVNGPPYADGFASFVITVKYYGLKQCHTCLLKHTIYIIYIFGLLETVYVT